MNVVHDALCPVICTIWAIENESDSVREKNPHFQFWCSLYHRVFPGSGEGTRGAGTKFAHGQGYQLRSNRVCRDSQDHSFAMRHVNRHHVHLKRIRDFGRELFTLPTRKQFHALSRVDIPGRQVNHERAMPRHLDHIGHDHAVIRLNHILRPGDAGNRRIVRAHRPIEPTSDDVRGDKRSPCGSAAHRNGRKWTGVFRKRARNEGRKWILDIHG